MQFAIQFGIDQFHRSRRSAAAIQEKLDLTARRGLKTGCLVAYVERHKTGRHLDGAFHLGCVVNAHLRFKTHRFPRSQMR